MIWYLPCSRWSNTRRPTVVFLIATCNFSLGVLVELQENLFIAVCHKCMLPLQSGWGYSYIASPLRCKYALKLIPLNSSTANKIIDMLFSWDSDPNAILCPFEVGGQCKDPVCQYLHTHKLHKQWYLHTLTYTHYTIQNPTQTFPSCPFSTALGFFSHV